MRRLGPSLLALLLAWAAVTAALLLAKEWGPTRELRVAMVWGGWLLPVAWFGMVVPVVLLAPRGRPRWWPPLFAAGAATGLLTALFHLRLEPRDRAAD